MKLTLKSKGSGSICTGQFDSEGRSIDFMLSENRDIHAAKRFFKKALSSPHNQSPRVITVDKNPAYPPAIDQLKDEKDLSKETIIRQTKYLNNIVEQDHRFIKKITNAMMGFKSFQIAEETLAGIEAFHNYTWDLIMWGGQRLCKETLSCRCITIFRKHEINGFPLRINGSI